MAVKLKDIAEKSGVSISTISRILSNDTSHRSKQETIDKVVQIARDMGYFEQRAFAPSLGSSLQVFTLGCIFTSDHESFLSPFFSQILAGIEDHVFSETSSYTNPFDAIRFFKECLRHEHIFGVLVSHGSSTVPAYKP